jgi:TonB family protein
LCKVLEIAGRAHSIGNLILKKTLTSPSPQPMTLMSRSVFQGGPMYKNPYLISPRGGRRAGMRLFQASVLALAVALAIPARAADERAVKARVVPVYPELALRMKITGTVQVQATIDSDGKVTAAKAIAGNRLLSTAAEEAVQKWKFASGGGETTLVVSVNFALAR